MPPLPLPARSADAARRFLVRAIGRADLRLALAFAIILWIARILFVLRRWDLIPFGGDVAPALAQGALLDAGLACALAVLPVAALALGWRRTGLAIAAGLGLLACAAAAVETEYFAFERNRFDAIFVAYAREWRSMGGSTAAQISAGFLVAHGVLCVVSVPLLVGALRGRASPASALVLAALAAGLGYVPVAHPRQARTWFGSMAARAPEVELVRALRSDALASRRRSPGADTVSRDAIAALRGCTNPFDSKRFADGPAPMVHTGGAAPAGTWGTRTGRPLNVAYVMLEAFEADAMRADGGSGLAAEMDELAEKSLFFRNFFANGAHTPRAMDAALCGLVPRLVGAPLSRAQPAMPVECLPAILKRRGYETAFIHGGSEVFENRVEFLGNIGFRHTLFHENFGRNLPLWNGGWGTTDEVTYRKALEFLDGLAPGRPFFLTVLSISNHHPFHVPDPALEIDRDPDRLMNNTVRYTSREASRFLEALRARGRLDDTVVFVFGDHGLTRENLQAGALLHEKLLHRLNVPLLVLVPAGLAAPRRVERLASQDDLMPTVLDLLALDVPSHAVGHSLGWALRDRDLPVLLHDLYTGVLATVEPGRMTLVGLDDTAGRDAQGSAAWGRDGTGRLFAKEDDGGAESIALLRRVERAVNGLYESETWWVPK